MTWIEVWLRKQRVARADRAFRDALARSLADQRLVASLSPQQHRYASLACSAMNWWIDTGRAGEPAPGSPLLGRGAPPRDKIILAYVGASGGNLEHALHVIAARGAC